MTIPPPPPPPGDFNNQNPEGIPQSPGYAPPPGPDMSMPPIAPGQMGAPQAASNGAATTAMILGIVSFFCGFLTAIPAIIFGFIGRGKAKELGGVGSGQAMAGIILGIASLALSIIAVVFFIFVGALAEDASSDIRKDISRYEERSSRYGEEADTSHYVITDDKAVISEFGSVTYEGYFTNKADFRSGYSIEFTCENEKGEVSSSTIYISSISTDAKSGFKGYADFLEDPVEVECSIDAVQYSF